MKVIIAGSRTCTDYSLLEEAIRESGFEITTVLCGGAKGADILGKQWAINNMEISIDSFPVNSIDWQIHGSYAGNLRNIEMAREADALIALWDGKSTGTKHMIETMKLYEKLIYVKPVPISIKNTIKEHKNHPKTGFFT